MSDQKVERIESSIDRPTTNAMTVNRSAGGTFTVAPQNVGELLEFAKLMSVSGFCVRPAFRGNPGACLGVAMQAFRCGGDPFAWANKAYITKNKAGEEQISFEAQLVHATVNSSSALQRRLRPIFEGEGPNRRCRIEGWVRGESEMLPYDSPPISQIGVKNSPLWSSDPDQQLFYYSTRAWARRHVPEILLGIYAPEDFAETIDITPEPEPRREDFIAKPEPVDDRPKFAVCDNDGVVEVFRDGNRAAEAIAIVLHDAARHDLARLEAAWENNQKTIVELGRDGFAEEVAALAGYVHNMRKRASQPVPGFPAAGHPGADEGGSGPPDRPGDPSSSRGDEQHPKRAAVVDPAKKPPAALEAAVDGAGSASETKARQSPPVAGGQDDPASLRDTGQTELDARGGDGSSPQDRLGSPLTRVAADPVNGPSNPEQAHRAPAASTPAAVEAPGAQAPDPVDASGRPEMFIAPPMRAGKPDFRTWAVALFMPKVRQTKEGDRLAFLIGDNDENLRHARLALKGDDLRELDAAIAAAQAAAVWPS